MDKLDKQLQASLHGKFDEGWKLVQELEKERPNCNRCAFNRGWYKLARGEFLEGFSLLDRGRWESVYGSPPLKTSASIANLGSHKIMGTQILLRGEGGLGDEIINVRFAQQLAAKGALVVVSSSPGLSSIFQRMPSVVAAVPREKAEYVRHDFWVPAMSAPFITGSSYETLSGKPYLTPDPELAAEAKEMFADEKGLKIGLRWTGNPKFEHEQYRKFPAEIVKNTFQNKQANFYSLEIDHTPLFPEMQDLRPALVDWEHTAAILSSLDLVITSCTSVAHMSAALGVPTWIIIPILPYYIWALPGEKSPWYDSVTLFRQTKFRSWNEPFLEVSKRLDVLISTK